MFSTPGIHYANWTRWPVLEAQASMSIANLAVTLVSIVSCTARSECGVCAREKEENRVSFLSLPPSGCGCSCFCQSAELLFASKDMKFEM